MVNRGKCGRYLSLSVNSLTDIPLPFLAGNRSRWVRQGNMSSWFSKSAIVIPYTRDKLGRTGLAFHNYAYVMHLSMYVQRM